jgi:hypothetical protein
MQSIFPKVGKWKMENRKIEMKNCILKFDFPYHIRNIFFNSNDVDMMVISLKIMVLGYWIDVTEPWWKIEDNSNVIIGKTSI